LNDALRVLVTGAGGYVGRHVVRALLDAGADVVAVGRSLRAEQVDPRAALVVGDIFDSTEDPFVRFGSPDVCIHLAWESGFTHDAPGHMLNLSNHYDFLLRMVNGGLRHLLVLGTMHEVGYYEGAIEEDTPTSPLSLYGISKDSLRRALFNTFENRPSDDPVVLQWLRCFYIVGDDEHNRSVFTKLLHASARGDTHFPLTLGTRKYDFIGVHQLAEQIVATALQVDVTGIINGGSGEAVELRVQVERYVQENGINITLNYGAFPERAYDSPAVWGSSRKMKLILDAWNAERSST
jgi:dTDP-6-deoxy-L-talose 4-dehydrogenase (NAD+)